MGYCFGGQMVLEMVRTGANLKAAVSLHGVLSTKKPARKGEFKGEILVIHGHHDPYALPEDLAAVQKEMIEAEVHWHLTVYGEGWHQLRTRPANNPYPMLPACATILCSTISRGRQRSHVRSDAEVAVLRSFIQISRERRDDGRYGCRGHRRSGYSARHGCGLLCYMGRNDIATIDAKSPHDPNFADPADRGQVGHPAIRQQQHFIAGLVLRSSRMGGL